MSTPVSLPDRFEMLHFLTPIKCDTIVHEPWPSGHAWLDKKLKKSDPHYIIRRRPTAKCNPAWDAVLGGKGIDDPNTLYAMIQDAYIAGVQENRLMGSDETIHQDLYYMRVLFAAFCVFRGLVLNRRHDWKWDLLPTNVRELMPEDPYGPPETA